MISIVIPTYNEENYLPDLLENLRQQSYSDYEIIISDNYSTDNTRVIARKYGCKIVNGGHPAVGRNRGAKIASYDLLFIDADCTMDIGFLNQFITNIKNHNLSAASCRVLSSSFKLKYWVYFFFKNMGNKITQYFQPHASGQCLFIKKNQFSKIGGFDESLFLGEEHDLIQRAMKNGTKYMFLLNLHLYTSPRRIATEGFIRLMAKNVVSEFYRLLGFKITKPFFSYKYGHYSSKKF